LVAAAGVAAAFLSGLLVGGARSAGDASGLIAFVRGDGVYVMRADGSGVRLLRRGFGWVGDLAWSPDGRRLAFVARDAIWLMDADGSDPVRLTPRVRPKFGLFVGWMSPSWSPDGRRIAYSYSASPEADRDVWVMDADGSNRQRLAKTAGCAEVSVDWSPKGGRLVVTCVFGWGTKNLILMSTDGSDVHSLLEPQQPHLASSPDWSPDGRRIVFAEFNPKAAGITVIDVADRSLVRLTPKKALNTDPVWSSDGSRIAFARFGELGGIYVMHADGTGLKRLTHGDSAADRHPAWQPVAAH
jgi:Tol biopolymer transport system component